MATRRKLIAIDGEGIGRGRGHRYVHACSSEGDTLEDLDGITPAALAQWLLELRARHRYAIFVCFGSGYEAAMLCRGLTREQLGTLWAESEVEVTEDGNPYGQPLRIHYMSEYRFGVVPLVWDKAGKEWFSPFSRKEDKHLILETDMRPITVNDIVRFTQETFLESLERFGVRDPKGIIARGKERRSQFRAQDIVAIRKYCRQETHAIADLAERIYDGIERTLGKKPRMYGAGAVAAVMLGNTQAKERRGEIFAVKESKTNCRSNALDVALRHAYFGGRTELYRQGVFDTLSHYDLRSAYAWAVSDLPDGRGTWKLRREYEPDAQAVWRCEWKITDEAALYMPFPYRRDEAISYPMEGIGWYHSDELTVALERWPNEIRVTSGYVFTPEDPDVRPFAALRGVYELRESLRGDPVAHLLKLGLSATWGKLAQPDMRIGKRTQPATYRDMFWAGLATARVRARLARAVHEHKLERRLVSQSTDAILLTGSEPAMPEGEGLGDFSSSRLDDAIVVGANIYGGTEPDTGDEITVTSGFLRSTVSLDELRQAWLDKHEFAYVDVGGRRFVGLGTAILLGAPQDLGLWIDWPQVLEMFERGKHYDWAHDDLGKPRRTLLPPARVGKGGMSEPYRFEPVLRDGEPREDEHEKSANSGKNLIEGSSVSAPVPLG